MKTIRLAVIGLIAMLIVGIFMKNSVAKEKVNPWAPGVFGHWDAYGLTYHEEAIENTYVDENGHRWIGWTHMY